MSEREELAEAVEFRRETGVSVRRDIPAAPYTTMQVGGTFRRFIEVQRIEELGAVLRALAERGEPYRVLGGGSNVIVADSGVDEWVIRLGKGFRYAALVENSLFRIGAAMPLIPLSSQLSGDGYSGLEFAGGIPATLGGAASMNAGAHGSEIFQLIEEIEIVERDGTNRPMRVAEIESGYRFAKLPPGAVVASALLRLVKSSREAALRRRAEFLAHRKLYQPITLPSSGSIFKNPQGPARAGELIRNAGLCGRMLGGAKISELHGNWIVNPGRHASAADVLGLIDLCRSEVANQFSVELESEVRIWPSSAAGPLLFSPSANEW